MDKQLDMRGVSCPGPVITTKKALEEMEAGELVTIVNNEAARDNVVRFAQSQNCLVRVEEQGCDYYIHISKGILAAEDKCCKTASNSAYLITSDKLGKGDDELGSVLIRSLLYSLAESEDAPGVLIFMNSGVKLVCEGSPVLAELKALEKKGTELLACGTCLDFFHLKEKLCVGSISNMYAIVEKINETTKIISI
ncbi:sulfurtransferase-like selenium metabolism protein YedF [Zhaonella formicivorans]|uniref:sulfurtransferase-like selenium metabolism protein YedF n=1 Tax=Zhaonella formicivorans TaxID=2528593 RepID=UPI0010DAE91A|nr:sulfurtransferase-like selenium metabolism protein YedF [Zhaonella formicivorans]